MSNARRPANTGRSYRAGYLKSPEWFARRDRWFRAHARTGIPLTCQACGHPATSAELELHHTDYHGVYKDGGRWHAREPHGDLVPLNPGCHELLHRLIDRDAVLSRGRDRRTASALALDRLRAKLNELDGVPHE
ncbi:MULTISPECIES: hypothetical protein [Microbacterium]|uniref:hypothetical protein n=1 Tax=Microbacterium TaxID=33882 RepID=UPI00146C3520|nr:MULTISPECIES: hypothetical protein [Microbacterium]